jgi:hypothetical protein
MISLTVIMVWNDSVYSTRVVGMQLPNFALEEVKDLPLPGSVGVTSILMERDGSKR